MDPKKDHPGIYLPPPVLYITTFLAAILLQHWAPLTNTFFHTAASTVAGLILALAGPFFLFPALKQFFKTGNTLMTIKPANTLQTTGIYSFSRNPMYVGLAFLYTALSFLFGNWWNFLLFPLLILLVQEYVIKREEKYLTRHFGQAYTDYQSKVRRWL